MLYFKFFKTTLNYKNKETLYIIFFLYVIFLTFKMTLNYENVNFP